MSAYTALHPDAATSLMLAVIASSTAPLLLLDAETRVVAASASFYRSFEIDATCLQGSLLKDIGAGEWDWPPLAAVLRTTAAGNGQVEAFEMDLCRDGHCARNLVLNAKKLAYSDANSVRILLTVSDVTGARLAERRKEEMLREKGILLQELQHRVANSLQIIASVLIQSARRVQSEESRIHLHDAHHRVMSIAALQRQLALSSVGEVALRPYFADLCDSIGGSMISNHEQLSIQVDADSSVAPCDVSVSLGLIVTELVINALKHAFPRQRHGTIWVAYRGGDSACWTLSVSDDGVGKPAGADVVRSGLGTAIIEALAKKLHATVRITDAKPGTLVSIVCLG